MPEERWEPDAAEPRDALRPRASERVREPPAQTPARRRRGALTMPTETAKRVMKTAEGFAGLAAGGPELPAEPASTSRSGATARVAFGRGELQALKDARGDERRDGQRRDPRGRRGRAAALLRAAAATRSPSTSSRWSRSASAAPTSTSSWATGSRRSWSACRWASRDPRAAPGVDPRGDGAAEGVGAGARRVADHRGDRVDPADDQPRALRPRRRARWSSTSWSPTCPARRCRSTCSAAGCSRSIRSCRSRRRTTRSRSRRRDLLRRRRLLRARSATAASSPTSTSWSAASRQAAGGADRPRPRRARVAPRPRRRAGRRGGTLSISARTSSFRGPQAAAGGRRRRPHPAKPWIAIMLPPIHPAELSLAGAGHRPHRRRTRG